MLIWKMAVKGILAHKIYSITLFVLILVVSLFSCVALDVLLGGSQLWMEAYESTDTPTVDMILNAERYTDEYLSYFESKPEVEKAEAIPGLIVAVGQCSLDGREKSHFYSLIQIDETLKGDECIASYGLQSSDGAAVGSTVVIKTGDAVHTHTITSFRIDPLYGDTMTPYKRFCVSKTAFEKLAESAAPITELAVHLKAGVDANEFSETFPGISATLVATTRARAHSYALIIPNMVSYFLLGIAGLMVLVGLLVIRHAILAALESDYKMYGILKGIGFSGRQMVSFILLQYMLIAMAAALFGIALSVPMAAPIMEVFLATAGIPAHPVIIPTVMGAVAALIGALTLVTAWLNAQQVTGVSPVRAIAAGTAPVHFSKRVNLPLRRLASLPRGFRLAVKQMSSRAGQYVLVAGIGCIFTFLLITTLGFRGAIVRRESAAKMFGFSAGQLYFQVKDETDAEAVISLLGTKHEIESTFVQNDGNGEIDGNLVFIRGFDDYERADLAPALSGRHPKYDNEAAITPQICDLYHLSIGDMITLGDGEAVAREYIITGLISNPVHMGEIVLVTTDGLSGFAGRENNIGVNFAGNLDAGDVRNIIDHSSHQFEGVIYSNALQELDDLTQPMRIGITATIGLILGLTVFLILLITILVSLIAIYRERADMGIFRASGYSVRELRRQFSLRFLMASGMGAALGLCGGFLLSDSMMTAMLSLAAVSSVKIEKAVFVMVAPVIFVVGLTTLSAFFAARHVRKVDVKSLTAE